MNEEREGTKSEFTVFCEKASGLCSQMWKNGKTPALIYFNIEQFHRFNEDFGTIAGDDLISDLANVMEKVFSGGRFAKVGADCFLCLDERSNTDTDIIEISEQVQILSELKINAGIYVFNEFEDRSEHAICVASGKAKRACDSISKIPGRYVSLYDGSVSGSVIQEIYEYLLSHLEQAVSDDDIEVFYQPIVNTETGEACRYEALARWNDPIYGILTPDKFIGTLEAANRIFKLDLAVVERVCRDYSKRKERGYANVPVSVNISKLDFMLCDMFKAIDEIVMRYGVPKEYLSLEIAEKNVGVYSTTLREAVLKFHSMGYKVLMDDFGSGLSTLNTLNESPFDMLKIDSTFLQRFDERSKRIIKSIVLMANSIGIKPIAEGVETKEQNDFLKEIGCEMAQGFYYGKPKLAEEAFKNN